MTATTATFVLAARVAAVLFDAGRDTMGFVEIAELFPDVSAGELVDAVGFAREVGWACEDPAARVYFAPCDLATFVVDPTVAL